MQEGSGHDDPVEASEEDRRSTRSPHRPPRTPLSQLALVLRKKSRPHLAAALATPAAPLFTPGPFPRITHSTSRDLIKQVRQCKTAQEERDVISKEAAALRQAFKEQDGTYRHRCTEGPQQGRLRRRLPG